MASTVYLVESREEIAQQVVNRAMENGFEVFIFHRFSDLQAELLQQKPDAVLLHEPMLPEDLTILEVVLPFFSIVYAEELSPDKKVTYYHHGIDRIIDSDCVNSTILIELLKFQLKNSREESAFGRDEVSIKSWKEFDLPAYLRRAVDEKMSFVLKLIDEPWTGKLQLIEGRVRQAYYKGLTGNEAVLQLLHHSGGEVLMKEFSGNPVSLSYATSTFGIIQEYQYEQLYRREFLEKTGLENPLFKLNPEASEIQVTFEESELMATLRPRASFRKITAESPFPFLETLKALQNLLDRKIVGIEHAEISSKEFLEDDLNLISERLYSPARKKGVLLVIGSSEESGELFLKTVAMATGGQVNKNGKLQNSILHLNRSRKLLLVRLTLQDDLPIFMEGLKEEAVGAVFILDLTREFSFDYKKYFIRQFLQEFDIPVAIGVTYAEKEDAQVMDDLVQNLEIPSHIPLLQMNPADFAGVRSLLLELGK